MLIYILFENKSIYKFDYMPWSIPEKFRFLALTRCSSSCFLLFTVMAIGTTDISNVSPHQIDEHFYYLNFSFFLASITSFFDADHVLICSGSLSRDINVWKLKIWKLRLNAEETKSPVLCQGVQQISASML